jgi:2,3-bisphosphoglycerate-dependent phosphoglycerate mutase
MPGLQSGRRVIKATHGNSLWTLVKHLPKISNEEILPVDIPTRKPLVYELDDNLLYRHHYYLE